MLILLLAACGDKIKAGCVLHCIKGNIVNITRDAARDDDEGVSGIGHGTWVILEILIVGPRDKRHFDFTATMATPE